MEAKFLYFHYPLNKYNLEIYSLRPKKRYWRSAVQELNARNTVTVHRRWFEGECERRANKREYFCNSSSDFSMACFWTQAEISKHVNYLIRNETLQPGQNIILLTDHQKAKYDKTFKFHINKRFQVEMCMMALSSAHFGNPMSSIDYVVAHWRSGLQFPPDCFTQIHIQSKVEGKSKSTHVL